MEIGLEFERTDLPGGRTRLVKVTRAGSALSWGAVAERWRSDAAFAAAYAAELAAAPYAAFFWETPPVSGASLEDEFETVLVAAPTLANAWPTPEAFAEHIGDGSGTEGVRTFDNLGRDAWLIAPCANEPLGCYAHLASFLRRGPRAQVRGLWAEVGRALALRLAGSERRTWVSTSGLGVSWVHVRLDSRPKYITHDAYRR